MKRAHVVVPDDLLEEVDKLVGSRRRSEFFVEAVREKLEKERVRTMAHELVGSLADQETPGWETPESASAWVRSIRQESDEGGVSGVDRA